MKCLETKRKTISHSQGAEESKESTETPKSERNYTILGESLEVRSKASSPERAVNTDSASTATSM